MEMANTTSGASSEALSYDFARKAQDALTAAGDLSRLAKLARLVVEDLGGWVDRLAGLSCARPCDHAQAAILVLSSLFAETLEGPALQALTTAMVDAMVEVHSLGAAPEESD